jgi:hypothetical protein
VKISNCRQQKPAQPEVTLACFLNSSLASKIIGNGRIINPQGKFPILEGAEKVPMCQIFDCQQQ